MQRNWRLLTGLLMGLVLILAACGGGDDAADTATEAAGDATEAAGDAASEATAEETMTESSEMASEASSELSGTIEIDGSSTVGPLTSAISEEYAAEQPDVTVNIGVSGTGGGFERFCGTGDTQISNASRPIADDEVQLCEENGINYTEIRVGTDALTMVVNPEADYVDCLNDEQITAIWSADRVTNWSEVPDISEDQPIEIFAPASTSGTYDFFNETIEIEEPTQDYSATENDNDIVRGVSGTPGGWGYFGFAFFQENQEQVKALAYDGGEGCVEPSVETAQDDSYQLTRPLFIYVKNEALTDPVIEDFVRFYLNTVNDVIADVGLHRGP